MSTAFRHREETSCSQVIVLTGVSNQADICWTDNTAGHNQSRRFLECIDDSFLTQETVEELMRRDMLWDHILTNKQGLIRDVKVRGSLDCSDHEMVELRIMRAGRKAQSRS